MWPALQLGEPIDWNIGSCLREWSCLGKVSLLYSQHHMLGVISLPLTGSIAQIMVWPMIFWQHCSGIVCQNFLETIILLLARSCSRTFRPGPDPMMSCQAGWTTWPCQCWAVLASLLLSGEARALVPYALQLAVRKLDANSELEKTILACAQLLNACYENLSPAKFQAEHLKINCRKFCTLLVALVSSVNGSTKWHLKPELHMFQELCETMESYPSLTWTYRDEDAGGGLMQVGRRRGGSNNCWATCLNVLDKFKAKNRIPVL